MCVWSLVFGKLSSKGRTKGRLVCSKISFEEEFVDVVFCPLVVDGVPDAFKFFDLNLVVFCLLNQIIGKAALSYIIKCLIRTSHKAGALGLVVVE